MTHQHSCVFLYFCNTKAGSRFFTLKYKLALRAARVF